MKFHTFEELAAHVDEEIAISDWLLITQARVSEFARVTDDPDWMHVDEERAKEGPVGQTIAQGFLTLALLLPFTHQCGYLPEPVEYAFNYGLNRVRWLTPVKVGSQIRNHTVLKSVESRGAGEYLVTTLNTVEIEREARPAMVAEWLGLVKLPAPSAQSRARKSEP